MPTGVIEWYNMVQDFLGTLHSVLETGASNAESFDPVGSQKVKDLEYNWLSLLGYYKGISPLLLDFYFNYMQNDRFKRQNGGFVRTLNSLISSFTRNTQPEVICKLLENLTSTKDNLFQDGAIKSFLIDLDEIVRNRRLCLAVIEQAQMRSDDIAGFLLFLLRGAKSSKRTPMPNSEL